jgi:hypothetical protein
MCLQILKNRRQEKSTQAQRFLKTQIEKSPPRFFQLFFLYFFSFSSASLSNSFNIANLSLINPKR